MKKIVFLTYHNWESKRQGGFHKLAEAACHKGYETVFFSFSRPYYLFFKNEERLNRKVLCELSKGKEYTIGMNKLLNITFPTLSMPGSAQKLLPGKLNVWLLTHSFRSLNHFVNKYFSGTEIFVFESNESVFLVKKIKKQFPEAKIIYRPSDPLIANKDHNRMHFFEQELLESADLSFIVNKEGVELYKKKIPGFDKLVNYKVLSNGVDLEDYRKKYPVPVALQKKDTALYLGARDPDWQLIYDASIRLPEVNFVIIFPGKHPQSDLIRQRPNIEYITGISPKEVASYVTNTHTVIVPNPRNRYKEKPWGITAKYYQAMAAKKPIVAFHDNPELKSYGVAVTYELDEFVLELKNALRQKTIDYSFNLDNCTWQSVCDDFYSTIETIKK